MRIPILSKLVFIISYSSVISEVGKFWIFTLEDEGQNSPKKVLGNFWNFEDLNVSFCTNPKAFYGPILGFCTTLKSY